MYLIRLSCGNTPRMDVLSWLCMWMTSSSLVVTTQRWLRPRLIWLSTSSHEICLPPGTFLDSRLLTVRGRCPFVSGSTYWIYWRRRGCWGASRPPHLWSRMWTGGTMLPPLLRMQASIADLWGSWSTSPWLVRTSPMRLVSWVSLCRLLALFIWRVFIGFWRTLRELRGRASCIGDRVIYTLRPTLILGSPVTRRIGSHMVAMPPMLEVTWSRGALRSNLSCLALVPKPSIGPWRIPRLRCCGYAPFSLSSGSHQKVLCRCTATTSLLPSSPVMRRFIWGRSILRSTATSYDSTLLTVLSVPHTLLPHISWQTSSLRPYRVLHMRPSDPSWACLTFTLQLEGEC